MVGMAVLCAVVIGLDIYGLASFEIVVHSDANLQYESVDTYPIRTAFLKETDVLFNKYHSGGPQL